MAAASGTRQQPEGGSISLCCECLGMVHWALRRRHGFFVPSLLPSFVPLFPDSFFGYRNYCFVDFTVWYERCAPHGPIAACHRPVRLQHWPALITYAEYSKPLWAAPSGKSFFAISGGRKRSITTREQRFPMPSRRGPLKQRQKEGAAFAILGLLCSCSDIFMCGMFLCPFFMFPYVFPSLSYCFCLVIV